MATQDDLRVADPAVTALDLVMQAWANAINDEKIKDVPLTVHQLTGLNNFDLDQQLREATYTRTNDSLNAVKVGQFFKRHQGRVRRGARLLGEFDKHRKQQTWRLVGWQSLVDDETVVSFGDRKASGRAKKASQKPPPGSENF